MTSNPSVLDAIGQSHNTDKASIFHRDKNNNRRPGHDYLRSYERFLAPFQHKKNLRIMELGAGPDWNCGASAFTWKEYFSSPETITIVDIDPNANMLSQQGFDVMIGDLGKPDFLDTLKALPKWDIIIDDASHQWKHQVECFNALFPSLNSGGIYIVEDLQTSYGDWRARFGNPYVLSEGKGEEIDAADYFLQMALRKLGLAAYHPRENVSISSEIDKHVDLSQIEMLSFIGESCILTKK